MKRRPYNPPEQRRSPLASVNLWADIGTAADFQSAMERGKIGKRLNGFLPEQTLAPLPPAGRAALVGQARAFMESDYVSAKSPFPRQAAAVVRELSPGDPAAAADAQAKTAEFLKQFAEFAAYRLEQNSGAFLISREVGEKVVGTLKKEYAPEEAVALLIHFRAFLQSPYGLPSVPRLNLVEKLQKEVEKQSVLGEAGESLQRPLRSPQAVTGPTLTRCK